MHKNMKQIICTLFIISLAIFLSGVVATASEVSIMGVVNEDGQLVDENDAVFEIAETEKGEELADKVGEKVTVKGTVAEADGAKTITVIGFEMAE